MSSLTKKLSNSCNKTALLLFLVVVLPGIALAQQFPCDGKIYYFGNTNGQNYLSYMDGYTTANPVIVDMCPLLTITSQNTLAANPIDNHLYFTADPSGTTLYRIDAGCNTTVVCAGIIPSTNKGTFDHLGRFWIVDASNNLIAYDLGTCTQVKGPFPLSAIFGVDIVFNMSDCHFYMADKNSVIKVDTNGVIAATYTPGFNNAGSGSFGGIAVGSDGNLYGLVNNSAPGEVYQYNTATQSPGGLVYTFPAGSSSSSPCGCDMASFPCPTLQSFFKDSSLSCNVPPSDYQFTNLSTGLVNSWLWDFGDGTVDSVTYDPLHTYTLAGTYTVSLIVEAYSTCLYIAPDTFSAVINVNPLSNANAGPDVSVCPGFSTTLSMNGGVSYSWSPATGLDNSTLSNPVATPAITTNYTVVATDGDGCTVLDTQQVVVNAVPLADFTFTDVCINASAAEFTDISVSPVSWTWDFGDGTPVSNAQSPIHIFSAPGTYSVTLIMQNSAGCIDTVTHPINVNPVPDAIFTSTIACFNNPTQFTDQSLGAPNQWLWNFGDTSSGTNNTSSLQNPTHVFSAPGTYTVVMITTNSLGCSDTLPLTAVVNPLPAANFIAQTVCIGSSTCFKDTSLISSGVISTWSWNFDDLASGSNNTSSIQHPCHLFTAVGTYNVILTVTSNNNCQSTTSKPVNVTVPPVASFTVNTVCLNSPTAFSDQSTGAIQWYWNFGDGGTSTLQNPSHVYLGYGNYVVSLIASAGGICTDTITDTVTVSPVPIVVFRSDSVCVGTPTSFTDLSFMPIGNIVSWNWNFGDPISGVNDTSSLQNPTHVFSSAGTYSVTFATTSAAGCMGSKIFESVIFPGPGADFSFSPASPIHLTDMITFTDQSTGSPVQWWWDFGDHETSLLQNPGHLYPDISTYTITLIATTQNGCTDTAMHALEILQFAFYMPNAFTPGIDGKNDYFFGQGVGIVEYELHIFDRWGNIIFFCTIKDLPQTFPCMWDGKVEAGASNERAQEDVYVWKVRLLDVFGDSHKYIGTVTVVK